MKILASCYLGLVLVGCGGDPFTAAGAVDGAADVLSSADEKIHRETDAGDELAAVLEHDDAGADAGPLDAGARAEVGQLDAGEPSYDASQDHFGGNPDAGDAGDVGDVEPGLPCDPNYGDASPGGSCCVHVWATPTMGAVLCTVDGSRWCWQTGMPCSAVGAKCVLQNGVEYCAP
jgi:hypothetical protein